MSGAALAVSGEPGRQSPEQFHLCSCYPLRNQLDWLGLAPLHDPIL